MKFKKSLYALAIAGACSAPVSAATLTFSLSEVGSGLSLQVTGAVTPANWLTTGSFPNLNIGVIKPSTGDIGVSTASGEYYYLASLLPPSGFGTSSSQLNASSFSGDTVIFSASNFQPSGPSGPYTTGMIVPSGYTGGLLSASATFSSTSLSALGITPGTYTWTVGTGGTADTIQIIATGASPVPEASGSVAGLGLAMAGLYQLGRRRQKTVTQ